MFELSAIDFAAGRTFTAAISRQVGNAGGWLGGDRASKNETTGCGTRGYRSACKSGLRRSKADRCRSAVVWR